MAEGAYTRIGKYEVQSELGRGGFGRVFRALDPTVGRPVAIKVLTAKVGDDLLTRFRNEAVAAGNLHHPNIVTVYELGEHRGLPFIAMEFLEGEDLDHVIAARKPLELLQKVAIMAHVADGLDYAHRHGVVHRDVKPSNIRLLPDGSVKIMDFGIARVVGEGAARLTRQGHVMGTLMYMAPEQVKGGEITALSDIFAYAVTYYELLTGKHPFQAPDPRTIAYKICSEDPEAICDLAPECPASVERILRRALQKDPELRYQSLQDLQYDTEPILMELRQERAAMLLRTATEHVEAGRMEEAQELLNEIVDLDPSNRVARQLRENVRGHFRRRALKPRIDALVARAEEAAARREYGEAISHLEAALQIDAADEPLTERLRELKGVAERWKQVSKLVAEAQVQLDEGRVAAAFESLSRALEIDPENAEARRLTDEVQAELSRREKEKRLKEQLRDAEECLLRDAPDEAAAVLAGLDAEERSSPEARELEARVAGQKAEHERRERFRAELGVVRALLDNLRLSDAVERLQRLKLEYPGGQQVSGLLVYAQQEIQRTEREQALDRLRGEVLTLIRAKEFARAAEALDAGLSRAHNGAPSLVRLRERIEAAREKWERDRAIESAIQLCPELCARGEYREAIGLLDSLLQRFAGEPVLADLRARTQHDYDRARRAAAAQRAIEEAESLTQAGNPERAVAVLQQCEDPRLHGPLAAARAALETKRRAVTVAALCRDARALAEQQAFDRAFGIVAAATEKYPNNADLERFRGELLAAKIKWEREQAVAAALHRARELGAAKRFDEGLRVIEESLAKHHDPALAEARQALRAQREQQVRADAMRSCLASAQALIDEGRPDAAAGLLEETLAKYPGERDLTAALADARDAIAARERGRAIAAAHEEAGTHLQAGRLDRAIDALRAALGIYDDPTLRQSLEAAVRKKEAERREREMADALRASAAAKEAAELWEGRERVEAVRRAVQDAATGDPRVAVLRLRDAAQRYPAESEIQAALGRAEASLRDWQRAEAIAGIEREVRNSVEDERFEEALAAVSGGLRTYDGDSRLRELRDWVLAQQTNFEQRLDAGRILRQSEALAGQGALEYALRTLEAAAGRCPDNVAIAEMRDRVQQRLQRQAALAEAERLIGSGEAGRAVKTLEAARSQAHQDAALESVLDRARRDQVILETLRSAQEMVEQRDFDRALAALAEALAEVPGEPRLIEAEAAATTAKAQWVRSQGLAREVARCEALLKAGTLAETARALEAALDEFPAEPALLSLREKLEQEWRRREHEERVARALADADAILASGDAARAVTLLEPAAAAFPDDRRLADALARARAVLRSASKVENLEQVCQETRLLLAADDFGGALETVERNLRVFAGEHRLMQLRETVIDARTRWERNRATRVEQGGLLRAANVAQPVTDETVLHVAERHPHAHPQAPARSWLWIVIAVAALVIALGAWLLAIRFEVIAL